jgi:hypothetical protein
MALMVVACGHGGIHPRPPLAFLKERHIASAQFVKLLEFARLTRLGLMATAKANDMMKA